MQRAKREKDPETGIPLPLPEMEFRFRLRGHGQDIDAGTYMAVDEHFAFKAAFKKCSFLELPGWSLHCIETGTTVPAGEFYDGKETTKTGKPMLKRL